MKHVRIPYLAALAVMALLFIGCSRHQPLATDAAQLTDKTDAGRQAPEPFPGGDPKFSLLCHKYMVYHAALKLGLSTARANQLMYWAAKPDTIDKEAIIPATQQWRHGYVYVGGYWSWGNADYCLYNNINANNGTGYLGKDAQYYYYTRKDKVNGDYYLGYALHYLADVGNPYHTSANIVSQLKGHENYEKWIENNWTSGRNFAADWKSSTSTISFSSYRDYVKNLSKYSYNNSGKVSSAFAASGYPTGANTGNDTLVKYTRLQVLETAKYVRGCIKKVMDQYSVW